jgi:hypothetical protein
MLQGFRKPWLSIPIIILFCACSARVIAARGWAVYLDNDKLAPRGMDRDHTGSFAIAYAAPESEELPLSLDRAVDLFDGGRELEPGTLGTHGFEAGVVAFTPEIITISMPQHDDRPYASLVYVTRKRHQVDVRDNSSFARSLTLGVLGLAAASGVQREIHQLLENNQPRGWNNQISDGGEPTFRYLWEYRQLQPDRAYRDGRRLQWATVVGFSIGYLTEGVLGLSLRYGHLADPWWSFHSSPTGFGDRMLSAPGQYGNGSGFHAWRRSAPAFVCTMRCWRDSFATVRSLTTRSAARRNRTLLGRHRLDFQQPLAPQLLPADSGFRS